MIKTTNNLVIPVNYAAILIRFVEKRGVDQASLVKNTGINTQLLDDPDATVSFDSFKQLVVNALDCTQEPALGLYFGKQLNLAAHGILGFAAMSSDTMGQALEVAVKYFRTRAPLFELTFQVEENTAVLQFEELLGLGEIRRFMIESLFSSFYVMTQFLFNNEHPEADVRVTYPEPSYRALYSDMFKGENIYFSQTTNQIRFPVSVLSRRLPLADPHSAKIATQQCEQKLASMEKSESLLVRVRRLLLQTPGKFPSLTELAGQLHTSPRTLRRQLQRLDTSYQVILDDVRRNLAVQYLQNTKLTVDQIASLLDYNDPSNFGRAFKKWTGKPPSSFRKEQ